MGNSQFVRFIDREMDARIFHIQKHLSENLARDWTVLKMAAAVHVSPLHFHKLFKKNIGTTPKSYLHKLRLARAYDLLSDPKNYNQIKQIGFSVGLRDTSHFVRDFRAEYGLTPLEFRRRCCKKEQVE